MILFTYKIKNYLTELPYILQEMWYQFRMPKVVKNYWKMRHTVNKAEYIALLKAVVSKCDPKSRYVNDITRDARYVMKRWETPKLPIDEMPQWYQDEYNKGRNTSIILAEKGCLSLIEKDIQEIAARIAENELEAAERLIEATKAKIDELDKDVQDAGEHHPDILRMSTLLTRKKLIGR